MTGGPDRPDLDRRCGSCARFVRVVERVDDMGEVKRTGECLLGVWPSPLYETSTCSQYVRRGSFAKETAKALSKTRRSPSVRGPKTRQGEPGPLVLSLPEDLLAMDADEFRSVLRDVIRDELGITDVELGGRWQGGEVILKPGKEGTQEKRVPIEALFRKIVGIRDRLRVLEQKVNGHTKLSEEDKVQLQQYVTQCYGSLTTFNVLFADKADSFVGQKGDKED